jgi:Sugar (and other) transporter
MLLIYSLAITCASYILYNIDPLTDKPDYLCIMPNSTEYESCDVDYICEQLENGDKIDWKVDWDSVDSLDNWVFSLDLMCVPEDKIHRMSNVYYLGEIAGGLSITRIPDVFGRKWALAIFTTIQFFIYLVIILSKSLDLSTAMGFFMGFLHIGIYNGCYINVCEYVHTKWKNKVCTLLLVFDMLTCILIGVYWRYISKDWLYLQIFALVTNLIAAVGLFTIPESPEYLYCFYKFQECRDVIFRIAKWNSSNILDDSTKNSVALTDPKILPLEYKFDTEAELRQIKFNKQVA